MDRTLRHAVDDAVARAGTAEGKTRPEELRLLFLAAALPTAEGEVLEIGSFKGRSTIALAEGARYTGQDRVIACDPFSNPALTDPEPGQSSYEAFTANLARHGLTDAVEVHRATSREVAETWDRPLRLLWIDGDHTYEGVKADADGFFPHLAPGAIVAFHDVGRSRLAGVTRCFLDEVVLSDAFGACGMTHYAGWAQFVGDRGEETHREEKGALYRCLTARLGEVRFGTRPGLLTRLQYHRLRRGRSFERWVLAARGPRRP